MLFTPKPQTPPAPPEEAPTLEQAQVADPDHALKLSQSLIKAIEQETMCPQFYKEYHWLRLHQMAPTVPQQIGQYFEWLAINNMPRGGKAVIPELTSRGQKSADVVRIERQAQRVVTLLERYDLHVLFPEGHDSPGITLQMRLEEYPDIIFEGSFDMTASSHHEPGVYTVVDLKATKTLRSKFNASGRPGWSDFFNMDHLQAYSYLWLARTRFPNRVWRFRYAVFSYDTDQDYQIFEIGMGSLELQELKQRVNLAAAKLKEWDENGFEPKGHPDCCTRCIHRYSCPACRLIKPITVFNKYSS